MSPSVGSRWKLDDALASTAVYRTGLPARFDHDSTIADPDVAAIVERFRPVATVAVPIKVEGRLWGAMIVSTRDALLPTDTEERLQRFTDLIATALANAEARAEVERLAEEQAALRRVAVLVAQQPSPSEVFTAVTQAVGLLLGADLAALHVFPGDGTATTIAGWSGDGGPTLPIGTRFPLDRRQRRRPHLRDRRSARMDGYAEAEGEAADLARSLRVRSTVGAPILVEGKLWGALMAATRRVEPWAENAETRIAAFTELVATAIANAESREALAELAEEQAALRRVATLVARGAQPDEVFWAVSDEVGRLFGTELAAVGRFEPDGRDARSSWAPAGRTSGGNLRTSWPRPRYFARAVPPELTPRAGSRPRARPPSASGASASSRPSRAPSSSRASSGASMLVASTDELLPPDTEERLEKFTETRRNRDRQRRVSRGASGAHRGAGGAAARRDAGGTRGIASRSLRGRRRGGRPPVTRRKRHDGALRTGRQRYHGGLVEHHRGCLSYRQAVADRGHERRVDGAPDGPSPLVSTTSRLPPTRSASPRGRRASSRRLEARSSSKAISGAS